MYLFLSKRGSLLSPTQSFCFLLRIPSEMPKHRSYFLWVHWSELSSRRLDLIGRLGVEVLPDGVVVYGSTHGDKQVPDGVSKWNDAVTFEKDHPQTVTCSAHQQLAQPRLLWLEGRRQGTSFNLARCMCDCLDYLMFFVGPVSLNYYIGIHNSIVGAVTLYLHKYQSAKCN